MNDYSPTLPAASDRLTPDLIAPHDPMPHGACSVPVFQTSSFLFDRYEDLAAVFAGESSRYVYSRGNNPTVAELESLIARMEGVETARGFASGMAAIAAAVIPFVQSGDRVVAAENLYSDAFRLFECLLKKFGVTTQYVDGTNTQAVLDALPGAALIYLESPASWSFTTQDLRAIGAEARRLGVISVIDNSWATPLYQRPAEFGIDLVVHAASKYLAGHSDTLAGLIAGPKALLARIDHEAYHFLGGKLSPFDAWLVLRGMRTLHLRMARHMQNGLALGRALSAHPAVARVRHPAFEANPGNACLSGYGGLFAFDLDSSVDIPRFTNALKVVKIGVSWGGPESLVIPAQAALSLSGPANVFQRFGTPAGSVRLAAGLENADDLVADVLQAIAEARQ
ncbi:PLP-dependent transferase [Leisingera sp. M658]|uniref:PLP-dependent transferase n=1 Tax=Leisingera sp. M658 TaxID=2867015 RepID=UPI0021A50524|nr:PLP-dependent transferase [Leisingera sp. M658]UWQ75744.1 PLP-dependent transferase [Leisingera sp. M658]